MKQNVNKSIWSNGITLYNCDRFGNNQERQLLGIPPITIYKSYIFLSTTRKRIRVLFCVQNRAFEPDNKFIWIFFKGKIYIILRPISFFSRLVVGISGHDKWKMLCQKTHLSSFNTERVRLKEERVANDLPIIRPVEFIFLCSKPCVLI